MEVLDVLAGFILFLMVIGVLSLLDGPTDMKHSWEEEEDGHS